VVFRQLNYTVKALTGQPFSGYPVFFFLLGLSATAPFFLSFIDRDSNCIKGGVKSHDDGLKNGLDKPFLRLFFLFRAVLMLREWVKNPRFGVYLVFMGIGLYREL
jgi:hypothetical protein